MLQFQKELLFYLPDMLQLDNYARLFRASRAMKDQTFFLIISRTEFWEWFYLRLQRYRYILFYSEEGFVIELLKLIFACQVPGSSALAAAAAGGTCGAHSAPSACSVNVISFSCIFVDILLILQSILSPSTLVSKSNFLKSSKSN